MSEQKPAAPRMRQSLVGAQIKEMYSPEKDRIIQARWEDLEPIRDELANYIMVVAEQINESVELVRHFGCVHVREFNVVVDSTNADLERFTQLYQDIQAKHRGCTGEIKDGDEHSKMLSIFEEYVSLRTLVDGALQPSLVAFTEYALEAKDIAVAKQLENEGNTK